MKANTTKQYPYLGDYYGYTIITSADGLVSNRVYTTLPTPVTMQLSVNLLGELIVHSPTKMQVNSYLKNILDANGEEIYTDGEWQIVQTAPILGPMGVKAGYKYRARLIAGNI